MKKLLLVSVFALLVGGQTQLAQASVRGHKIIGVGIEGAAVSAGPGTNMYAVSGEGVLQLNLGSLARVVAGGGYANLATYSGLTYHGGLMLMVPKWDFTPYVGGGWRGYKFNVFSANINSGSPYAEGGIDFTSHKGFAFTAGGGALIPLKSSYTPALYGQLTLSFFFGGKSS